MFSKMALTTILCATISTVYGAIHPHQFNRLPGVNGGDEHYMKSDSYSGYLNVTDTKRLHYVFLESHREPANDPIIIWFNGGPGCSSLLGFLQENGPWVFEDGAKKMTENPYPWTAQANVLYIESPAGVGFSYGSEHGDLKHHDMSQSRDAFTALEEFYKQFPKMLPNELFISGESYAGIYVPYLAWQVYQNNLQAKFKDEKVTMNLKGYLVGNGATNWDFDVSPSFPTIARDFNLIPPSLYHNYTESNCKVWFNDFKPIQGPAYCKDLWAEINTLTENLNWYDLYRPVLADGGLTTADEERVGKTVINGVEHEYKRGFTMAEYTPWLKHMMNMDKPQAVLGAPLSDYLNQADVRLTLHIDDAVQPWEMCNGNANWTYAYSREASQWIYPILKQAGIRQIFYSGDTDGAVGLAGTRQWIKELDWPIRRKWAPWFMNKDTNDFAPEVQGFVVSYEGLDFATVHGVGHMAPQWARQAVQDMIFNWIENKDWAGLL